MPLDLGNPALITIDLPTEGEWVRVKTAMSKADKKEIGVRTAARAQILGIPLDVENDLMKVEATYVTLAVVIREWSFPSPITTQSVRALDDDSQAVIFERLFELLPKARTEDDLKKSSASGAGQSSEEAQSPQNSDGSP